MYICIASKLLFQALTISIWQVSHPSFSNQTYPVFMFNAMSLIGQRYSSDYIRSCAE